MGDTATAAFAVLVESATLTAVTVTFVVVLTLGAANKPEDEIVPALAFQVTPVLPVPLTRAENCWVPPEITLALVGEIEIVISPADPLTVRLNV